MVGVDSDQFVLWGGGEVRVVACFFISISSVVILRQF